MVAEMELWFLIFIYFSICAIFKALLNFYFSSKKLPPGPLHFPILGHLHWLPKSMVELESVLRSLHTAYGPILTLRLGRQPFICVADRYLAYEALIKNGAVFASRPPATGITQVITSNQQNISAAFYGPKWRLFRLNLISGILHPSRINSYSNTRKWVLQILLHRLKSPSTFNNVSIIEHFRYAMFFLLSIMCFGHKIDEKQVREIMRLERAMFLESPSFSVLNFLPRFCRILFGKRWSKVLELRKKQEDCLVPLIRERKKMKHDTNGENVLTYVDTLLDLQLPGENRKLNEEEMVTLCNEFLNGGTDTTSTALEWIMANLVKYPNVQEKLIMEIKGVVGDSQELIKEEDLEKMVYLKAVILEGLRRHPPTHFVLPHAVTEDVMLGKYLVPKNGIVSFMAADMGWDPKVWEDDPMMFKPERFMGSEREMMHDLTGSREIKMMPFGVGRRMCPAYSLAMLHLEYFVVNLVWNLEWKAVDGDTLDLSEKHEITTVMKNPLKAHVSPRFNNT